MSAPKFRAGDVVQTAEGDVYRVGCEYVMGGGALLWLQTIRDGASVGGFSPRELTLLRRPVRIGDVLRYGTTDRTVTASHTTIRIAQGYPAHFYGFTHADGTPIEPPPEPETTLRTPPDWEHAVIDRAAAAVQAQAQVREALPTAEQLARALFETDERVVAFVDRVSDWTAPGQRFCSMRTSDDPHWSRAMQTAWQRDEHGWRTEAERRAEQVLDRLRGQP